MTAHDVAQLLPDIARLHDLCRSLAVLEAILSPEWEYRYYSFNADWSCEEEMASMRNGSGDEYSIIFSPAGAYVRGFAHESVMSPYANEDHEPWPGVLDSVPEVFRSCVQEPAFCDENGVPIVTVCLWRQADDDRWHVGEIDYPQNESDPDGSADLFGLLTNPSPEAYQQFAEDYYEVPVDLEAVRHIYALHPLTQDLVSRLNPEILIGDLTEDLAQARYPTADSANGA
ncbi:hypothetical protein [Thermomonospora cellulosilytica]|uniref:Uncharacterized protein n=1 Tax=Thermomonospora cellulosilytica TaxID=1411118 RepID=A0A7W3MX41_9ACTN|nr:hypothetical protein [Thermomonospora cellulosilytica]MBA9003476.1 hypothetical protein [Thermomonospora cellulosilytica]